MTIRPQNPSGTNFFNYPVIGRTVIKMDLRKSSTQKPKYSVLQNSVWIIQNAAKSCPRLIWITAAISLLETAFSLAGLYIIPAILNVVQTKGSIHQLLGTIGFFTAALFFTKTASEYFAGYALCCRIETRCALISQIGHKCSQTSYPNTLEDEFIGLREKSQNAMFSNAGAAESIWLVFGDLLKNIGGLICCLLILSHLNLMLMLFCALTCFLSFLAIRRSAQWEYSQADQDMEYSVRTQYIRSKAESSVMAKDIRIFKMQPWLEGMLHQVHERYMAFRLKAARKYFLSDLADALCTAIRTGVVYAVLIGLVLNHQISVSDFILYFAAVSTFTGWIQEIFQNLAKLHKDSLDLDIMRRFLDYPEPFCFASEETIPLADGYEICLKDVSFRYPGSQTDTIHKMNLTIHAGQKLAVVGLNGAGKTTLVKLICGLLDPDEGQVLLNGQDIRTYSRQEYYKLFSAVFQEFSVLDATVQENITQSAKKAEEEKLQRSVRQAGIEEMIFDLPKGLDTHVGREIFEDGVLFSGGQVQRLILARALYKNGPILLLDEPTAALDPIAENDIYSKYSAMTEGKTSVFISHRLASTRFCDRILFLQNGQILEEGTHDSLLRHEGSYAALFEVQSQYYQEGRDF